jgi:hypothetical protein
MTLSWTAGAGATSHDVYLDTVNPPVAFLGNQAGTTFEPATLAPNTWYYWRIDELGSGGTAEGDVWSFKTGAGQATAPSPAHGEPGVVLMPTLQWTPGAGTDTQDIYFGTSEASVASATTTSASYEGNFAGGTSTFIAGPLSGMTFYYWRIDSVTPEGVTKGEVWQFRTGPSKASTPSPSDFATGIDVDTLLTWAAGTGGAKHDVYFGTSFTDVLNADTGDAEYAGRQPGTTFDPGGGLAADTWFYWRIDEVAADGTTVTTGDVWRFKTAP